MNSTEPKDKAANQVASPCSLVIFGATGDLTQRKLAPALYNLNKEGLLPAHFACVGFARREKSNEDFRNELKEGVDKYSRNKPADPALWESFSEHVFYHRSEFDKDEGYQELKKLLDELDKKFDTEGNRIFYLSVPPSYFTMIVEKLAKNGLIYNKNEPNKFSRVIIEKPFGNDYDSAVQLQKELRHHLDESQIYRIDHYLGKETVQNLLVFRFTNPIFEQLWNRNHIDHVQITVAEEIGIGTRGKFWEEAGMLRDIVQNHLMQLVSLVGMEPPINLDADSIRGEKTKVIEACRPFPLDDLAHYAVRGQYAPGYIDGEEVKGYRQENDVKPDSNVETFVALKVFIDNWRWAGVPFYLRAGKRLPKRTTEIAITFKEAPSVLFKANVPNTLVIRIQPDEGIALRMNCKVPGLGTLIQPVKMDFRYGAYFGSSPPEAYERLICDCMSGDSTLFARDDEVFASWKLLTPLLEKWREIAGTDSTEPFPNYASGTWGPKAADKLIEEDGHSWRLL